MTDLNNILNNIEVAEIIGNNDISIKDFDFDSRNIGESDLFIAIQGTQTDGHKYINQTIEKGAAAIVCQEIPNDLKDDVCYIKVKNSAKACGIISSNFYGNPSSKLKLIGITGTNGKTSTVTMLFNLFRSLGKNAGLLSTVENKINDKIIKATHTTPDQKQLNKLLKEMLDNSCEYVFMEVSSHAISQYRTQGLDFDLAIFSNITHDHLDYHKTFQKYLDAKKKFFDDLKETATALVNSDDRHSDYMIQNSRANKLTYGLKNAADFKAKLIENHFDGINMNIDSNDVWIPLVGKFNAYNIMAVYTAAVVLGIDKMDALTSISNIKTAEGRFEYIKSADGKFAIVDYAHTPDALQNVTDTINEIREKNSDLIIVVGTGGNRDKTKRPIMTKISCEAADRVILTSDNPRNEDPEVILDDMMHGIEQSCRDKILRISKREEAIKTACALARKGDIILIAGKGHEKYQEINGVRHHFDDKEIVEQSFKTN